MITLLLGAVALVAIGVVAGIAWERWRLTRLVRNYFPLHTPLKSKPSFEDTDWQWKHLDVSVKR